MYSVQGLNIMAKNNEESSHKLHPVTFCTECNEAIPVQALACLHCGARQQRGEKTVQIVFCDKCGEDYPAKAHSCFHCGHLNPHSRYLDGHISSATA